MTLLKPVRQKTISDQVFEQLKELIFRGRLKPGDQLVPEREMAESMKVSRTTVRNAISRLAAIGLVEHTQGRGTFVAVPDPEHQNPFAAAMASQNATIFDLLELRIGLECHAAAFAAERADARDIHNLNQCMKSMKKEILAGRLGTSDDAAFHMTVACAAKNPLHIQVMKSFHDHLFYGIMESLKFLYEDKKNMDVILNHHQSIIDAIVIRDRHKAFEAMQEHIDYVIEFFREREKSSDHIQ